MTFENRRPRHSTVEPDVQHIATTLVLRVNITATLQPHRCNDSCWLNDINHITTYGKTRSGRQAAGRSGIIAGRIRTRPNILSQASSSSSHSGVAKLFDSARQSAQPYTVDWHSQLSYSILNHRSSTTKQLHRPVSTTLHWQLQIAPNSTDPTIQALAKSLSLSSAKIIVRQMDSYTV